MSRYGKPRSSLSVSAAIILAAVFVVGVLGPMAGGRLIRSGTNTGPQVIIPGPAQLVGGSPIANGAKVSLSQAQLQAPFHVYRPQDPLASDKSISQAWFAGDPLQVALDYDSGIRIYLKPVSFDPITFYQEQQAEGVAGTIQTILNVPAFVVSEDLRYGEPGSVDLVVNGIEVAIVGHGNFTSEQLLSVAQSVT